MRPFDPLIALLSEIPDPRRAEGKLYQLPYVLLFSILAVVTGGNSYRAIKTFIAVNRERLNTAFGLCWKRAPTHTAIRTILQSLDPKAVEQAFRRHAMGLLDGAIDLSQRIVALDGKTLRRSFAVSCSNRHQKYICGRAHVVYYPDLYYFWRRW